ncbi:hypothetical protein [Pontibacter liquoris]|uniref:hypothetical protein n=1 Tax=Pontibacter liquoris TaxID=2905677 RepID=UPI001FA741CB|nr:hypothetical protein [Pontibacter liquoris]
MKSNLVTRLELYKQVWSEPISSLSLRYNVSDYDLRKLCKELQIPLPQLGHWQRIKAGKKVPVPVLLTNETVAQEIDFSILAGAKTATSRSPLELLQLEIEHSLEKVLKVPPRLTNPDILIASAKADIEERNARYRFTGLLNTSYGFLDIKVSKQCLDRTFRLMNTLIKALQARGHNVLKSSYQICIHIRNEKYEVAIREKQKRSDEIRKGNYSFDYIPTGTLVLKIGPSWSCREWQDGKVPLESRLSAVIAYLEWKTQKAEARHLEHRKAEEVRLEKERIQRELQARKEQELHRFKVLLQQAKRWQEAQLLRAYIAAMEQQAEGSPSHFPNRKEWLAWAGQKADWYDPLMNLPDALLDEVDKDSLAFRKKVLYG